MKKTDLVEGLTMVLQMECYTGKQSIDCAKSLVNEAPTKRTTELAVTYLALLEAHHAALDSLLEEVIEYGKSNL